MWKTTRTLKLLLELVEALRKFKTGQREWRHLNRLEMAHLPELYRSSSVCEDTDCAFITSEEMFWTFCQYKDQTTRKRLSCSLTMLAPHICPHLRDITQLSPYINTLMSPCKTYSNWMEYRQDCHCHFLSFSIKAQNNPPIKYTKIGLTEFDRKTKCLCQTLCKKISLNAFFVWSRQPHLVKMMNRAQGEVYWMSVMFMEKGLVQCEWS